MKLYLLLLMISINGFLYLQTIPGTPIYAQNLCIYPDDGRPPVDFASDGTFTGSGITNSTNLNSGFAYPTNKTNTNGVWSGPGNFFSPLLEFPESVAKNVNLMVTMLSTLYPMSVIENLNPNCYVAENGQLVSAGESQIWVQFLALAKIVFFLITAVMIFYVFTGKSFGLTQ